MIDDSDDDAFDYSDEETGDWDGAFTPASPRSVYSAGCRHVREMTSRDGTKSCIDCGRILALASPPPLFDALSKGSPRTPTGRAPCGHPGEHVIGSYVRCLTGCEGAEGTGGKVPRPANVCTVQPDYRGKLRHVRASGSDCGEYLWHGVKRCIECDEVLS